MCRQRVWSFPLDPMHRGKLCRPLREGGPLSFAAAIGLLQDDATFCAALSDALRSAPYGALRWECPPVSARTVARRFEFVVLDAPDLVRPADPEPFREALARGGTGPVATFSNLGGDAVLVVPRGGPDTAYADFAGFLRAAPAAQVRALWHEVGAAMQRRLGAAPVWLSTAGGGVAWPHVRLDDRPKYYVHAPYRAWAPPATLAAGVPEP